MSKKVDTKNIKSFKIVILMLAFAMLGSLYYIYKSSDRSKNMIVSLREQKSDILKNLEKSELFLNQVITTNKSLSQKLVLEQNKVTKLIKELKSGKVTEKTVFVYKQNANNVDNQIKLLLGEINSYKNKIDSYKNTVDSTNVVLKTEKSKNDTLIVSNKKLVKKVTNASKLYFYDLETNFFKVRGSGKQIETDKANKIDLIKISFMIAENDLMRPFNKDFYTQIIDSKNNILGSKKDEIFGNETLTFSSSIPIKYENKTVKGQTEIQVSDLKEGTYFINIFDKSKLILKSIVSLK